MSNSEHSPYLFSREKRYLDIAFASACLSVYGPLEYLARCYLRTVLDDGDDYFVQERDSGQIVKLRTMIDKEAEVEAAGNTRHGERIPTKLAKLIRLTRVDEAPQLRHILNGTYSAVSPRPTDEIFNQRCLDVVGQKQYDTWQAFCKTSPVKPGATSPAQVANISYDEMDADYFARQVDEDIRYCREASLIKDIEVLIGSAVGVASVAGHHLVENIALGQRAA